MAQQDPKQSPSVTHTDRLSQVMLLALALTLTILFVSLSESEESTSESAFAISTTSPVLNPSHDHSVISTTDSSQHPLDPVLKLAEDAIEKMRLEVRDYTATLLKRERIGGVLGSESSMDLKVINPKMASGDQAAIPMHVYLKFNSPSSSKGREVIWIEGLNNNQLIAHEGGFKNFLRMNLDPNGSIAMLGNRYPITGIGLIRLVEKLIEKGTRDRKLGPCDVKILDGERVGDRACRLIQVVHPKPESGMDFHIAHIFFDSERMIPLRYAAYGWPKKEGEEPPLDEEYTYLNVKMNVGLTEEDFNPDNPNYDYP